MTETEQIKDRLPIEQLIGSYVPLKKAGRIYKACCPFHGEKTPSFTVSPERGIFKCFGCGEGGDIFDFVMKIDGLSFSEAITLLAERAGVELTQKVQLPAGSIPKERLFKLNTYVAKLWHTLLVRHPKGEAARRYLENRGLQPEIISTFQIGYAPLGTGTALALRKAEFSSEEQQKAGEPSRFQDRITFPLADITGKVVGFTGRLLELDSDPVKTSSRGPKYWNTPETAIFNKSRTVFGLHLAKRNIQSEDVALLVEGQMDVVSLHQAGYTNAVASSGTALTSEQIRLLSRFSPNIAFAYDQDAAGIEATKRGIELVLELELNPFVIVVPRGKDPAECLQKSPGLWQEAYINRQPFMNWLIEQSIAESPELTPTRKKELVQQLLPWLTKIKNEVEQAEWLRWLAGRLQTEEKHIRLAFERLQDSHSSSKASPVPSSPNPSLQPGPGHPSKAELALALLLAFPAIFIAGREQLPSLSLGEPTPFLDKILPLLVTTPPEQLKEKLNEDEQKELSLYVQEVLQVYQDIELTEQTALEEFFLLAQRLRSEAKEEAKVHLAQQIRLAQQMKDTVKLQQLFSELKNLV